MSGRHDVIDVEAIAAMLGVARVTVHTWARRKVLPTPSGHVSGRPWWERWVIEAWAEKTGRWGRPFAKVALDVRNTGEHSEAGSITVTPSRSDGPHATADARKPHIASETPEPEHSHTWVGPTAPGGPWACGCGATFLGWDGDGTARVSQRKA